MESGRAWLWHNLCGLNVTPGDKGGILEVVLWVGRATSCNLK
jgi:hypothetical protein